MKIAALLNVHGEPNLVMDTLDSIRMYMTEDVLVLVDAAGNRKPQRLPCEKHDDECCVLVPMEPFGGLPACKAEGFWHGRNKSPFRNLTLGLKLLSENWHDADWYCYIEYDCLVTSSDFKEDLEEMGKRGVWMVGNDHRRANYSLPLVEKIVGMPIPETHVMLGCCWFLHRDFVKVLRDTDFFTKFLHATNGLQEAVPGFDLDGPGLVVQGAYDYGEIVYPTLARLYGGKLTEFAHFELHEGGLRWVGNWERYPMRFRPDIGTYPSEQYPDASIIHPLKSYKDPARAFYRELRKRENKWKTSSIEKQAS